MASSVSQEPPTAELHHMHLRVLDSFERVEHVHFDSVYSPTLNLRFRASPKPERRFLKCFDCEHHDWREGISMNHYECDSCGYEVQVTHVN